MVGGSRRSDPVLVQKARHQYALSGSEDREPHDRLAGIAKPPATIEAALVDEFMYLIFCSDSEEYLNGFSDCDD